MSMKAYILSIKNFDDKGEEVVFAENAEKAKNKVWNTNLDPDELIDVRVKRAPEFDGMENATEKEMYKEKWRNGWWIDANGYPDYETATDDEFYKWFDWFYK